MPRVGAERPQETALFVDRRLASGPAPGARYLKGGTRAPWGREGPRCAPRPDLVDACVVLGRHLSRLDRPNPLGVDWKSEAAPTGPPETKMANRKDKATNQANDLLLDLWNAYKDTTALETLKLGKTPKAQLSTFVTWCVVTGKLDFHG